MTRNTLLSGKWGIVILIVFQIILGSVYLNSIPRIYIDEVWDSSLAYNLASQGALKHPFVEGLGGMDTHFVQNRIVLAFVQAVIFKIAGFSIATSRIGSLLFGILATISIYSITRRWFGEKAALLIGLATVINPWFFEVSRHCRPEIYYTALGLVFLWMLTIFSDSKSRLSAFSAGIFAGLCALTHVNGLIIIFSISFAIILFYRIRTIGRLILWGCVGFFLLIVPYIIYVFWATQDPQVSFIEQMHTSILNKSLLFGEIYRWKNFFKWPKGMPLALIMLVSWITAWYRSTTADKTLAAIIAIFALILPCATVNINARYLVTITPFFCALIVRFIWRMKSGENSICKNWYKTRLAIIATAAFIYLSTSITAIGLFFYCLRGADFTKVINRVSAAVGQGSRIYGEPIFWIGYEQYKYGPYLITFEGMSLEEAIDIIRKHNFDYAVRTAWSFNSSRGISKPPRSMPDFRDHYLCDWVCRIFGTKTDEFYDPYYGPIEIYSLDWNKPIKKFKSTYKNR